MKTTTVTVPLAHLYQLTADSNNDTGYTIEEVIALIDEHGNDYKLEVTVTHPTPPPYTVEWDIEQTENRIAQNQKTIEDLKKELENVIEDDDRRVRIQEDIPMLEKDIVTCEEHIASLNNS